MHKTMTVPTDGKTAVINVTGPLREMVHGVREGLAYFYVPHTTAALIICEDDADLRQDLVKVAEHWLAGLRPFKHVRKDNPNTEAHVISAFGGAGVTVAIIDGRLDLGTYQNILLIELDGPKERQVRCQVITSP